MRADMASTFDCFSIRLLWPRQRFSDRDVIVAIRKMKQTAKKKSEEIFNSQEILKSERKIKKWNSKFSLYFEVNKMFPRI